MSLSEPQIPANRRYRQCVCGHMGITHENFRPGTECGICACRRFTMHEPSAFKGFLIALPGAILLWSLLLLALWLIGAFGK